jgi:hypothetical protein
MIVKSTILGVILFLGSLAVAEAQSYVSSGVAGPQTVLGWNFAHAANCVVHYDGVNHVALLLSPGGRLWVYEQSGFRTYTSSRLPNWKPDCRLCL